MEKTRPSICWNVQPSICCSPVSSKVLRPSRGYFDSTCIDSRLFSLVL